MGREKEHKEPNPNYRIEHNPIVGIGLVLACGVGLAFVAVDDFTGIGIADNALYIPLSGGFSAGIEMIIA